MKKLILALITVLTVNTQAATYYFQGNSGGSLATAGNWTTNPATFVAGAVVPGATDDVIFNVATANNTTNSPTIYYSLASANKIYNSITMLNAGPTTFYRSSTLTNSSNTLEIGSGGFTVAAGAGPVTIGTVTSSTNFGGVTLRTAVNTTVANNSSSLLTLQNTLGSTAVNNGNIAMVTFGGTGTGGYVLASGADNKISSNTNNVQLGITMNNALATLAINATGNYSGGTILNAGMLSVGNNLALGLGTVTLNGGTMASATIARTLANNFVFGGDFTLGGYGSAITLTGGIDLNNGTRAITLANSATFNGNMVNGTGLNVNSSSTTRSLTLAGTNTYTGDTVVNNAILNVNGSLLSAVVASTNSTVNIAGTVTKSTVSGGTLLVSGNGGETIVNTGTATVNSGGVIGTTTINGSLLAVNGTAGNVLVNTGGTLGGSGSVGNVLLNGGTIAPGNSPGLLTAANLNASNGSFVFELGAPTTRGVTYDAINVTNLLTLGTNTAWIFQVNGGYAFQQNDTYDLFDWSSIDTTGFDVSVLQAALPNLDTANTALQWDVSNFTMDGTISVIPEPTVVDLIAMPLKLAYELAKLKTYYNESCEVY